MSQKGFKIMTSVVAPICYGCKHRRVTEDPTDLVCDAYPEGIPQEITLSRVDHRQPHEGDHGIQFDPVDERAARYAALIFDREEVEA